VATSDRTLRAVLAEDAAAHDRDLHRLVGVDLDQQVTVSSVPYDGSILVGLLVAVISVVLIDRNRRFLLGETVEPTICAAALTSLRTAEEIGSVSFLHWSTQAPRRGPTRSSSGPSRLRPLAPSPMPEMPRRLRPTP
jgi:hypothetical protein